MPFPGMHRSVAKWLHNTNVPKDVAKEATQQLHDWLKDENEEIGCKHYATKALLNLSRQGRFSMTKLKNALRTESKHHNPAYRCRVQKLLNQLESR